MEIGVVETLGIVVEIGFGVVVFCGEPYGEGCRIVATGGSFTECAIVERGRYFPSFVPVAHYVAVAVVQRKGKANETA